jgi:hypothetical protein
MPKSEKLLGRVCIIVVGLTGIGLLTFIASLNDNICNHLPAQNAILNLYLCNY